VIEHERERAELTAPSAAMDAGRRVSEQDCTKPVDYSLGNIRCK
jgi:hypothetical protein